MLHVLDWFFLIFHTTLVVFNMMGWAWARTRRLNLVTLTLTGFSWLIIGLWNGRVGYCVCTDWHWQVRRQLGYEDRSETYIQFLVERIIGVVPSLLWTQIVSATAFAVALTLSLWLNWRDFTSSRRRT